jgi:hypothetical protein
MLEDRPPRVTNLSGALIRARPPFIGAATPADFFAAYESAFGRAFPPDLLPDSPLRIIGDRGGRRFAREQASELQAPQLPPRRTDIVQLLVGVVGGPKYWHAKFSLHDFVRDCPPGFFLAGFNRLSHGSLRFYYMRRNPWSRVLFRLPCRGRVHDEGGGAADIPDFLEAFSAFTRALRPRVRSLVACEKSGSTASYEIVTASGETCRSDLPRFHDPQFASLALVCGAV